MCEMTFFATIIVCWIFVLRVQSTVVRLFALGIYSIQIHRCIPFAAALRFLYRIVQTPNLLCQHACITKCGGIFF